MFDRTEMKNAAKAQLVGKWGGAILVTFILGLISGAGSSVTAKLRTPEEITLALSMIALLISWISLTIQGPVMFGKIRYFFELMKSPAQPEISLAFSGFGKFIKATTNYLWMALWTFLWTLLFIIPGIIKGLAYSQNMYIVVENPGVNYRDALKISMRMTQGYKAEIFIMQLSFIGWALLCILTCGIGLLWLGPYIQTTYCNMYYKLKELSIQSGACLQSEFDVGAALLNQ